MSEYVMNKETGKLELHFEKADYLALSDELKSEIKSNFLFSRTAGAWVSRAKFPNLYRAERVAEKLGLENGGAVGEVLSFAEQMERKADKAESRAERYEQKADKATERAESLQKPINDMHGDIAFFTQPNISTSAGRAFTNKRRKMFEAWERGFDEFKKSEYYAERAEIARQTASQTRPTDKGFCDRRIKEAEKAIKAQRKNIEEAEKRLERIKTGEVLKQYDGAIITAEDMEKSIKRYEMQFEAALSKAIYYRECLEALGGVEFSKDNIKKGYVIELNRWGRCKVVGIGRVNVTYKILDGGAAGFSGKAAYAEIIKVLSTNNTSD